MEFNAERFTRAVQQRTGMDHQRAAVTITAAFEAIGRALAAAAIDSVAALLPDPLAESLRRGAASPGVGDVLVDLAVEEHVSLGVAKEQVQVVLEQLAASVDDPTRAQLASLLPEELSSWLQPWQPPPERHARAAVGREHTLASGRPGSEHPLHEAGRDRGQHDSIALTSDPHVDTRLSSTRGIASERNQSTLADGRPGSEHPVSEGHD
ncbi:MAG TPA: hypothetical protein VM869_11800 [Enhygromyxa sp.]|nr:hypothetical protein [Enhygromyxa sp.]